jgi:hypothetical protein
MKRAMPNWVYIVGVFCSGLMTVVSLSNVLIEPSAVYILILVFFAGCTAGILYQWKKSRQGR